MGLNYKVFYVACVGRMRKQQVICSLVVELLG